MLKLTLLLCLLGSRLGESKNKTLLKWDDDLLFQGLISRGDYDKSKVPQMPTETRVGFYVNSLYGISQVHMEYSMSFYLRMAWTDPRLRFDGGPEEKTVRAPDGFRKQVWTPDLFFRNEKSARYVEIIAPQTLMRLSPGGEVWHVMKYTSTLSCPMKLQRFPFDTQTCSIMIESFGYTMDSLHLRFLDSPFDVDPGTRIHEFTLMDAILHDCSQNYTSGSFPCLEIRIVLRRTVGHYIMQVYIPSTLLVLMSWTQFYLEPAPLTSRVLVALFCSFTLVAQMTGLRSSLPAISYVTAMDMWMIMCLVFTSSTLLQLCHVAILQGRKRRGEKAGGRGGGVGCGGSDTCTGRVDICARVGYPVSFLIFCIIYFSLYSQ